MQCVLIEGSYALWLHLVSPSKRRKAILSNQRARVAFNDTTPTPHHIPAPRRQLPVHEVATPHDAVPRNNPRPVIPAALRSLQAVWILPPCLSPSANPSRYVTSGITLAANLGAIVSSEQKDGPMIVRASSVSHCNWFCISR